MKLLPIGVLALLMALAPAGIEPVAWKTFSLFCAAILALILQTAAMGTVAILTMAIGGLIGAFDMKDAVGAFGSPVVWQIVVIFFLSRGFVKTGLSKRVSFHIIKFFGRSVLGLGYGFLFANLSLGTVIASSTARIGGIVFPIVKSVSEVLGSSPDEGTERKVGSFFAMLCLYGNEIVSATFLTGMAGNLVIKNLAATFGVNITWLSWFKAACVPSLICLVAMPLILYMIYPPQITNISKTRSLIHEEIDKLGKISKQEYQMIGVLVFILFSWIFADFLKLDVLLASFIGLGLLLVLDVISFDKDILHEKEAWNILMWLSSLLMLAKLLEKSGFLAIIVNKFDGLLVGFSWPMALIILTLIYAYTHYLFASTASHLSALYAVFLGTAIKLGAPAEFSAWILAFASGLFAGLHYYTATEAVILYNSRYISTREFFKYGLIMSSIILLIWMVFGSMWWKILGMF